MKKLLLVCAAALTLTACGGGGGGGGGGYLAGSSGNLRDVPFYTPQRIDSVIPVNTTANVTDSSSLFTANISTTTGQQDVFLAGRMTPNGGSWYEYNLQMWSWQNSQLVNRTTQWFSGTDNRIIGTEPSLKFGDFDGDGRTDMWVSPNTDTNVWGPGVVFFNNGTNFTRTNIDLGNVNAHDSAVYDVNGDGKLDILTTGSRMIFSQANRAFSTHVVGGTGYGGTAGSVAVADFLGNGTSTVIFTDQNVSGIDNNRLYSWSMVNGGNPTLDFRLTQIAALPTPRFLLPKWSTYGFTGSHDIRVLAFDFDNSGRTSAVIFSRPWQDAQGNWPNYSEIQFNKNMGGGVFIDVTDQVLIGYDHTKPAPYNPTIMDLNSDGLMDIVLGGTNWSNNTGAQVLIHTKEHKYVASYASVIKTFADQALDIEKAINASAAPGANGIVFVQGPDNQMYLATAVTFVDGGIQKKALYLSKLGNMTMNAQATADAIKQTWPWMSAGQVNTVLAQSSTTWLGLNLLDPDKAMNPIGDLKVPTISGLLAITGSVTGLKLNGDLNMLKVQDSLGRDYNVNYSTTSYQSPNIWGRYSAAMQDDVRSANSIADTVINNGRLRYTSDNTRDTAVLGVTKIDLATNTYLGIQYTRLPFNPFVALSGAWGQVTSSGTFESSLMHRRQDWVAKAGMMYTITEIRPGLVTRVNPMTSVWSEFGYDTKSLGLFVGVLPKVVSGSADVSLPTAIDNQGRILYTNSRVDIESPTVAYIRMSLNGKISNRLNYGLSALYTGQNQSGLQATLRYHLR